MYRLWGFEEVHHLIDSSLKSKEQLEDCFAKRKELFLHAQKQNVPKRKAKVAGAECLTLIAVVMGLFAVYKNFFRN